MKRKIIKIDEDKCDGCGNCIPDCPEGALQMIDGKARLVSDLFCDGLGACIGNCPRGAISIEEREAEPYDEKRVMDQIAKGGPNVIKAHLRHLLGHGEVGLYKEAIAYLEERQLDVPSLDDAELKCLGTCPSSRPLHLGRREGETGKEGEASSMLGNWPIQLHLITPLAPYLHGADLLVAADCVAYSVPGFHHRFLHGKSLIILCPKLDTNQDSYLEKLMTMIEKNDIKTITVMKMEVPCCSGILSLVKEAVFCSKREVPIRQMTVSIRGDILSDMWI